MPQILVVEDHGDQREAMGAYLRKAGFQVLKAQNGEAALGVIMSNTPDVVVLDLNMPEMDGARLLEIMRSYRRLQTLPVVVWTAVTEGPLLENARQRKVHSILAKGKATYDDLVAAVQDALPGLPA